MKEYNITILEGDGIGPEIIEQAIKVLNRVALKYQFKLNFNYALIGGVAIDNMGCPLPDETIQCCKNSDSVLLGAVGGSKWDKLPGNQRPEAGLLGIRKSMGLFANLRPANVFKSLVSSSPLKPEIIGENLNIMVVRELTGGIYFGKRGTFVDDNNLRFAFDTEIYNYNEIYRIAKVAFELAMSRNKKLCSVDKANVLDSSRLWRSCVNDVAKEYPEVSLSHMYVDNCAMQLIRDPKQFDVILTSNMFGDIISDEVSMISGSIGMLASASLGEGNFGLFEPVHGSAPDIAGKNTANPLATILSTALMLRLSLLQPEAANDIENAVNFVLKDYRTEDIYEKNTQLVSCTTMGDLVCSRI